MRLRTLVMTVLLMLLVTDGASAKAPPPRFGVAFAPDGALLTFGKPERVTRVELSAGDATVVVEHLPGNPIPSRRLFFAAEDRTYSVAVTFASGGVERHAARPAPEDLLPVQMLLQVPYTGTEDISRRRGVPRTGRVPFVTGGSTFTTEVELMSYSLPAEGVLTVTFGPGLDVLATPDGWTTTKRPDDTTTLRGDVRLDAPMRVVQFLVGVRVSGKAGVRSEVSASAVFKGDTPSVVRTMRFRIASSEELGWAKGHFFVDMPTDAVGESDVRRERSTILLPNRVGLKLRRAAGLSDPYADYHAPVTWMTLWCTGAGQADLPVAVSMRVLPAEGDAAAPGFRPPDYMAGPGGLYVVATELKRDRWNSVVLPVFARADEVLPGRYRALIELRLLGTDQVLLRLEHPIRVRATDLRALVVTAAAVVLSIAGLALFLVKHRRIFAAFRVSELVLIALFATMTFVLVIFPGSLLGPVFSAIAGPFGFLLQGVFFEMLRILVLVTLLVLVPRPGTVTLVSIVRYLIGGLAFGGFTPVDLFYLGTSVVVMEAVLYVGGVTSVRGLLSPKRCQEPFVRSTLRAYRQKVPDTFLATGTFLYVALLMGLVNGATQYVTYCLNISFYRLYFADWFIWLSVMVSGFLYAAAGTLPGLRLGLRLRRISE